MNNFKNRPIKDTQKGLYSITVIIAIFFSFVIIIIIAFGLKALASENIQNKPIENFETHKTALEDIKMQSEVKNDQILDTDGDYKGHNNWKGTKTEIYEIISEVAVKYKVDENLLNKIAFCESSLKPKAINGRDRGLFQINSKWNPKVLDDCAFDVQCSTEWVANQINIGNLWKWKASKKCWDK